MSSKISVEQNVTLSHLIKANDPEVANLLSELFSEINQKSSDSRSEFENKIIERGEELFNDSKSVEERELNGVMNTIDSLLSYSSNENLTDKQKDFLDQLEEVVFLKLNKNKVSELDSIDSFIESLLRLEYPKRLPTFDLADDKRNILNYIGLSLETISEKVKESTVSSKAVNNLLRYLPNSTFIVTDRELNIRFVGAGGNSFFQNSNVSMIDDNLCSYIYGFSVISKLFKNFEDEFELAVNVRKETSSEEFHLSRLTFVPDNKGLYSNAEGDEVEELIFKLDDISSHDSVKASTSNLISSTVETLSHQGSDSELPANLINDTIQNLNKIQELNAQKLIEEAHLKSSDSSQKEPIDINGLVRKIAEDMRFVIGFNEIILTLDNKLQAPLVEDYKTVYTIVRRLITTLVRYKKTKAEFCEIEVSFRPSNEGVTIQVSDNGIGIPSEWINEIFQSEGEETENQTQYGKDSGLLEVKNIVQKLGGEISLESKPNEGSTFKVLLKD